MASWERPKAIAIAGPTASGKSALSMLVARRWPCEIISVDSALIYRGMNIGTAKPTREELALVPHHLIDILDPTQSYSAAQFVQDAQRLIAAIHARGKLALLVGGTMLYFKALIQGIDDMPIASPSIRAGIDEEAKALGWPAMHEQLARIDPITAERLSPHDSQRIQRALEVYRSSGNPLSFFHRKQSDSFENNPQSAIQSIANMPLLSLEPVERSWLHQRIALRFEQMLQMGLIEEVMQLRQRGDLHLGLPSMRCVGYRQTWEMLDGAFPLTDLLNKGIVATRQLAKRQITWQRGMQSPAFNKHVLEADSKDASIHALAMIDSWLSTSH